MYYILTSLFILTFSLPLVVLWLISKPKNLKHIPSASLFENIQNLLSSEPYDIKFNQLSGRDLKQHKMQAILSFGEWSVLVSSPEAAKIIVNDSNTFEKRVPAEIFPDSFFSKFMGINVVLSNHKIWKRHRRVLNPPFKKQFDPELFAGYTRAFFEVIEGIYNGKEVDVYKYMQRITMDSLGQGLMGVKFNSVINDEVEFINVYNRLMKATFNPFYLILFFLDKPWNPFRRNAFKDLSWMENYFAEILKEKRELLTKQKKDQDSYQSNADEDILTLMLKSSTEGEEGFSDREIRDNIMIFILAGHDTTAFAMSAVLHFLAQNPNIQDKVRSEVFNIMEIEPNSITNIESVKYPTIEQVKKLTYLNAVIKETLRFYPSVARLPPRLTTKEMILEGQRIPAKTMVELDIYSMHHNEDLWSNPNEFLPERFLKMNRNEIAIIEEDLVWMPFGSGPRSCLGINFSLLEQKVVLSMILMRYIISYPKSAPQATGAPLTLSPNLLLAPVNFKLDFTRIS